MVETGDSGEHVEVQPEVGHIRDIWWRLDASGGSYHCWSPVARRSNGPAGDSGAARGHGESGAAIGAPEQRGGSARRRHVCVLLGVNNRDVLARGGCGSEVIRSTETGDSAR